MYERLIQLDPLLLDRSLFLLGPRQTGKSTLLKTRYPHARVFNLLEADTFRELSARPELVRQRLSQNDRLVVIDEIQRLPSLLDEVHLLIESNKNCRFVLTGSSARQLKRGQANLLAGRALTAHLFPLVSAELPPGSTLKRLNVGSLPFVFDSRSPREDLKSYVGTYLQEEIRAEGLARSLENFSRFLEVAGFCNGEQIDFTAVGNDSQVPPRTVREYYQVLEDTLLGFQLPAYQKTKKRKPVATAKFYFFDLGVTNVLKNRPVIELGGELFGRALEHLIFLEIKTYLSYRRIDIPLTYWRSQAKHEVDFIIGDEIAVEVKAKEKVSARDLTGLRAFCEEKALKKRIVVTAEVSERQDDEGNLLIPYDIFMRMLWTGAIV